MEKIGLLKEGGHFELLRIIEQLPARVEREIKMSEHTELPWYVDDSVDIRKCPDSFIATCNGHCNGRTLSFAQDEANAKYIVRACNSHKDLLEACNISEACFRKLADIDVLAMSKYILLDNAKLIKAAIKKAEATP